MTDSMRRSTLIPILVLTAITLFGALLRLDSLTVKYGWLEHPAWAVRVEQTLLPVSRALRPAAVPWGHVDKPYVGGDPANYLRFAREMRHFYQAHVREPVFLALTRFMLWVMGDSDIGISYASLLAGTLAIVATYLLGSAAHSKAAGLIAAAALAIELDAITWASDGWRDDTFMLFVALSAWAFVRLMQDPSWKWGVAAGVIAAGACLTRISSLSFVIPSLLWIALRRRVPQPTDSNPRPRWLPAARAALIAASVCAALVAPFLINCWRATGDPFFAINYHTRYYRAAEGLPPDESVSALAYLGRKLREGPSATADTAGVGLFVFPFTNKWSGFKAWSRGLAWVLRCLAVIGLVLAMADPAGRLLWLLLLTSLVPYALTWPLGGGGEWRFTQHVYPLYLVAAGATAVLAVRALRRLAARQIDWHTVVRDSGVRQALACTALLAVGWALYVFPVLCRAGGAGSGRTRLGRRQRPGLFVLLLPVVRTNGVGQRHRPGGRGRSRVDAAAAAAPRRAHPDAQDGRPRAGRSLLSAEGHRLSRQPHGRSGALHIRSEESRSVSRHDSTRDGRTNVQPARPRGVPHGPRRPIRGALRLAPRGHTGRFLSLVRSGRTSQSLIPNP